MSSTAAPLTRTLLSSSKPLPTTLRQIQKTAPKSVSKTAPDTSSATPPSTPRPKPWQATAPPQPTSYFRITLTRSAIGLPKKILTRAEVPRLAQTNRQRLPPRNIRYRRTDHESEGTSRGRGDKGDEEQEGTEREQAAGTREKAKQGREIEARENTAYNEKHRREDGPHKWEIQTIPQNQSTIPSPYTPATPLPR
ncbi:hypothetical protein EYC84_011078 [Monilinia fructicola]|nr:hypothetical protein EYC84_011078 [Monilinia fructicola]